MRYGFMRGALVLLLSVGLLLTACSEDDEIGGTTGVTLTAEELSDLGWDALGIGEYSDAVTYFEQSLEKSSGLHEARLGLGWALTYSGEYDAGATAFEAVVAAGVYGAEAQAGLAAAALAGDPAGAIEAADAALDLDSEFASVWIDGFDHLDLHLILAEAYFARAQYSEAQQQVELLDSEIELDPEQPDYVAALALAIEELRELVAG